MYCKRVLFKVQYKLIFIFNFIEINLEDKFYIILLKIIYRNDKIYTLYVNIGGNNQ